MNAPLAPRRKILIVEDEAFIAFFLEAILSDAGFQVIGPVDDAAAAFRLADQERPDLALMDIHIKGDQDGVSAARRLVEDLGVPVVIVSANAAQSLDRLRGLTRHILDKPIAGEELVLAVRQALAA